MSLAMTELEERKIDSSVEKMMDWAKSNQVKAEQLAMDSARLVACTSDRLDKISKQGFFQRCWSRFTGEAGSIERANEKDLIEMQKYGLRYINMLQENQVLLAHSMISLKNNLYALYVQEEDTRDIVYDLAQRTFERFKKLESRVDQLEVTTNIQGWLITIEELGYDKKYLQKYFRLLNLINDFYNIKNDGWNYKDFIFLSSAMRKIGLDPNGEISINYLIDELVMDLLDSEKAFVQFESLLTKVKPENIDNYSEFVLDNISSPIFLTLHGLKINFIEKNDDINAISRKKSFFSFLPSKYNLLKTLIVNSIKRLNVNLDYKLPLVEAAIEILSCMRLAEKLAIDDNCETQHTINNDCNNISINDSTDNIDRYKPFSIEGFDENKDWLPVENLPSGSIRDIKYINGEFICALCEYKNNKFYINLYTTRDTINWNLKCTINESRSGYGLEYDERHRANSRLPRSYMQYIDGLNILDLNDKIVVRIGNVLYCIDSVNNIKSYTEFDNGIDGITPLIDTMSSGKYLYTFIFDFLDIKFKKKGIIFDSDESSSVETYNLYTTDKIESFKKIDTPYRYTTYTISNFTSSNNGIYLLLDKIHIFEDDAKEPYPYGKGQKIIFSEDGESWTDIYTSNNYDIDKLYIAENIIYAGCGNYIYRVIGDYTRKCEDNYRNDYFNIVSKIHNTNACLCATKDSSYRFISDFSFSKKIKNNNFDTICYGSNMLLAFNLKKNNDIDMCAGIAKDKLFYIHL